MALDLERMLAPVSEDSPAGPDLAYDAGRYEIEQAFEIEVSVDSAGNASEAGDIDWRRIVSLIEGQSAKTKDLWLAVYLCRAGARSGVLDTVEVGAEYLAGLLERYWDTVHPQLEEYGFQGRKGPCDSLTRIGEFLGPLQRLVLLQHPRLGRFSAADFERFRQNAESEEGYGLFRAALADTPEADIVALAGRLDGILAAFRRTDAILTANAEGDTATNFQATYDALNTAKRAILSFTSSPAAAPADGDGVSPAIEAGAGGSGGGAGLGGRVDSREDVVRALDALSDYYRRREPTSPVPLLLQRAREWVNLDFMSVMEDIAPGSLDEVRQILISRRQKGEEY